MTFPRPVADRGLLVRDAQRKRLRPVGCAAGPGVAPVSGLVEIFTLNSNLGANDPDGLLVGRHERQKKWLEGGGFMRAVPRFVASVRPNWAGVEEVNESLTRLTLAVADGKDRRHLLALDGSDSEGEDSDETMPEQLPEQEKMELDSNLLVLAEEQAEFDSHQ